MAGPAYIFEHFMAGCSKRAAMVTSGALKTASSDFKLHTQNSVLGFIANEGLAGAKHYNTRPWKKYPHILVDAYDFYSGRIFGYIAFLFQPETGIWTIKSFKKNDGLDKSDFREKLSKLDIN